MKKLASLIFAAAAMLFALPAMAAETASLPSFKVTLNGVEVENEYREYPLFVYKDITYFPMTYFDCRFLGITTYFYENTGLDINKKNISGMYREYASTVKNPSSWIVKPVEIPYGDESKYVGECVEPAHYRARVNDRIVGGGDYPLMTLRGVTYFPLTWEYAHDEFGWDYGFTADGGLVINSGSASPVALDLPSYDVGTLAHDGVCVYYQGTDGDIYRAPLDDPSREEKLVSVETDDSYFTGKHIVSFSNEDGVVYAWYHIGGAIMGSDRVYVLRPGVGAEKIDDFWRTSNHTLPLDQSGWKELKSSGGFLRWNSYGDVRMIQGDSADEGNVKDFQCPFAERDWEIKAVSAYGSKFYVAAGNDKQTAIFLYDIGDFTVRDFIVSNVDPNSEICAVNGGVLFNRDGGLWLWKEDGANEFSSEIRLRGDEFTLIDGASANGAIVAVGVRNSEIIQTVIIDSITGDLNVPLKTASSGVTCAHSDEALCVAANEEISGEDVRLAVISLKGDFVSYFSSDMTSNPSVYNGILVYTTDGKAVRVNLDKPSAETVPKLTATVGGDCGAYGGDNVKWEAEGNTLRIYGQGEMADFIPYNMQRPRTAPWYEYKDYITQAVIEPGVTTVGLCAFADMDRLESVRLPEGIRDISGSAFDGCSKLKDINLPSTLKKIGDNAFTDTGIESLSLPAGLEKIEAYAFARSLLKECVIPDGVTFGSSILRDCPNLERVRLPEGITEIPDNSYVLYNCRSLTQIDLPDSLIKLGENAIFSCPNLKDIKLGNNLKRLGYNFSDCGIRSLTLPDGLEEFNGRRDITYYCTKDSNTWRLLGKLGFMPVSRD